MFRGLEDKKIAGPPRHESLGVRLRESEWQDRARLLRRLQLDDEPLGVSVFETQDVRPRAAHWEGCGGRAKGPSGPEWAEDVCTRTEGDRGEQCWTWRRSETPDGFTALHLTALHLSAVD